MKSWMWQILTLIIAFVVVYAFNIPILTLLLVAAPLFVFGLTYFSFIYSFRSSLEPEQIPERGYENRIAELNSEYGRIYYMQFEGIDYFYLKIIPDAIAYIYKHRSEQVFLCQYHLGSSKSYDFITYFENDVTLTTTASVSGGMSPRPDGKYLQIIENHPMETLFNEHMRGAAYLKYQGINAINIHPYEYRQKFMESIRESAKHIRSFIFWPARLVYWTITKRGKIHKRPIDEQLRLGIVRLPNKQIHYSKFS